MFRCLLSLAAVLAAPFAVAQMTMNMGSTMNMGGPAGSFTDNVLRHTGSGTSLEPGSGAYVPGSHGVSAGEPESAT